MLLLVFLFNDLDVEIYTRECTRTPKQINTTRFQTASDDGYILVFVMSTSDLSMYTFPLFLAKMKR